MPRRSRRQTHALQALHNYYEPREPEPQEQDQVQSQDNTISAPLISSDDPLYLDLLHLAPPAHTRLPPRQQRPAPLTSSEDPLHLDLAPDARTHRPPPQRRQQQRRLPSLLLSPPPAPPSRVQTPPGSPTLHSTPRSQQRYRTRTAAEQSVELTPTRRRLPVRPAQESQGAREDTRIEESVQLTPARGSQPARPVQDSQSPSPDVSAAEFYYAAPPPARAWKPRLNAAREPLQQAVDYRFILGGATRACRYCSALHWVEERRINTTKTNPQFTCCVDGAVRIPLATQYPRELHALLAATRESDGRTQRTFKTKLFHQYIRHYNNAFSFCSLGAQIDEQLARQLTGAYTFRAHGQLYHQIGSLQAPNDTNPCFAQIYIFDSEEEQLTLRQRAFENLDAHILRAVQRVLQNHHPFVQAFKTNGERIRNDGSVTLRLGIVEAANTDPRVYNRPTAGEIAVLIPTGRRANEGTREIVLENRDDAGLKFISEQRPEYLPLRYPLLYPHGELGWSINFPRHNASYAPHAARAEQDDAEEDDGDAASGEEDVRRGRHSSTRVSQQQWWKYHMQLRSPLPPQLLAGRLFHELSVDAFAAIAAARLQWLRFNQNSLRVASYAGAMDAMHANDRATGADIGQRVILPASYTGSPRQMRNAYLDAIALSRFYGPPDFFITFTCNPQWIEITRELAPGQTPVDRPDLVNRVFHIKLKQLLHELHKAGVLGNAAVYCYTIEFQKRGLPHAHLLLILQPSSRPQHAVDIDACVRATLPDPAVEPLLYNIVTRSMMHGPCGRAFPNAPCMREGRCRFNFPYSFQEETAIAGNNRPQYARPDDGRTFQRPGKDYTYTNRDVATYNAYLSIRFNAHINVESCAGYGSVKYAFKYVYKGPDYATVALQADAASDAAPPCVDEIRDFIDARYVAAHEALWRIFEFRTHGRSVPVLALAVHLEDQQFIALRSEQQLEVRLAQEAIHRTTLTEFFAENARAPTQLLYQDFPSAYTWSKQRKQWRPRRKGFCVGRIVYLPITVGEAYYLRLLLVSAPGQTSFRDARTFEGTLHPTFQAACLARGLLLDDGEYAAALEEAARFQLGRQLRELFVTILTSCRPADPSGLWERFKVQLADDCAHQLRTEYLVPDPTDAQAMDLTLCLLRVSLASRNSSLHSCGLPEPERDWIAEHSQRSNRLLREQLAFNPDEMRAEVAAGVPRMNTEQRLIYTTLCSAVFADEGGVFFVDGPGGTGKTFLQNIVLAHHRLRNHVALAVASSGIAATLLAGGTTAHSRFKIPIDVHEDSTCSVPKNSHLAELLRQTRLIFWDEAVMCHRHAIEAVSRTLQDLRAADDPRRERPFGGIVVCFCGDFRQTLPIVKKGTRGQIVSATLKSSPLWRSVHVFKLTQNMRLLRPGLTQEEREEISTFAEQLLRVGERADADGMVQWDMRDRALGNSVEALAAEVFPNISRRLPSAEALRDSAILAPKNDVVNEVNALLLRSMPGEESVSYSVDRCKDMDNASNFPVEFLHTITLPALPPYKLRVKPGCPVMLLRNLDPGAGLCNGTRLIVVSASRKLLRCTILGTRRHGEMVQLPRIPLDTPSVDAGVEFTRIQFPVKLSFAMTVNKAQGQSLSTVGLLLNPEVFSHGQLYVALSRVTRPDGIRMVLPDTDAARAGRVKNVVYTEVL